jgi:hypothetical protein
MENWKERLKAFETPPSEQAWNQIQKKRVQQKWTKAGITAGIISLIAATLFIGITRKEKTPNEWATVIPSSPSTPQKTTPTLSDKPSIEKVTVSSAQPHAALLAPSPEVNTHSSVGQGFPYNGRIQTQVKESTPINTISPTASNMVIEPEIELPEPKTEEPESNPTEMEVNENFIIANTFSPNGDGWNDTFSPALNLPDQFQFKEWHLYQHGKLLQTWTTTGEWNGLDIGGFPMNPGTYQYILIYENIRGDLQQKLGTITLQR